MWKMIDGRLVHTTDTSRVKFRTNISQAILESLKKTAAEHNTHVNYLIETGMKAVLTEGFIVFDKKKRPKDRVQYKTTYDKELLESVKVFAKSNNLFINDVLEYCTQYIDVENSKNSNYKHRVE